MSVSEPEKTSEENQQNISISLQSTTVNEKSDSPIPTLTPVKAPLESITTITPVSNDNLLDSNGPDIKSMESTSQLEVKLQAEEQESRNKDLKCIEETSPDINDNQKPVNESTHESLLQFPPLNSPLINQDNSTNGISVANEIIDTQGSIVKIQSMVRQFTYTISCIFYFFSSLKFVKFHVYILLILRIFLWNQITGDKFA